MVINNELRHETNVDVGFISFSNRIFVNHFQSVVTDKTMRNLRVETFSATRTTALVIQRTETRRFH